MSRDMKPRKRGNGTRRKSGGGTLLGLFVGLVIGVLIAAGVVWYIHRTPPPFTNKTPPATQQQGGPVQPPGAQTPPSPQTPLALPGKPGDPVPQVNNDKPRFDFYKILPGNGEATPETKPVAAKPNEPKPTDANKDKEAKEAKDKEAKEAKEAKETLKEPVFLQTGSFQNAGDADNQKARLAMMGVEASVQQVMLQDKVWYRVRLGPFKKIEDVNAVRADLARQGVDANVVK